MTRIPASIALVRMKGLEPPRLSALDPKSSAATNYATSAIILQRYKFLTACQEIHSARRSGFYLKTLR